MRARFDSISSFHALSTIGKASEQLMVSSETSGVTGGGSVAVTPDRRSVTMVDETPWDLR
jgi:hypothetical protein